MHNPDHLSQSSRRTTLKALPSNSGNGRPLELDFARKLLKPRDDLLTHHQRRILRIRT